ncbi:hypothetical protein, partial [Mycobacterium simiae]|uniref:hypothetical protein n=1 Tax=Mycobacterium simiae TaxID=1784 RepID=UPI001CB721F9
MTPAFPLGVAAGWARVVAVFVADTALLGAGAAAGGRPGWWAGAVLAALLTVAVLTRWRGLALSGLAWRSATRRGGVRAPAGGVADHRRLFGAGPVG